MPFDDRLRDGLRREADPIVPDTERHLAAVLGRSRDGTGVTSWLVVATAAVMVIALLVLGILPGARVPRPGTTAEPTAAGSSPRAALEGTARRRSRDGVERRLP